MLFSVLALASRIMFETLAKRGPILRTVFWTPVWGSNLRPRAVQALALLLRAFWATLLCAFWPTLSCVIQGAFAFPSGATSVRR